MLLSIPILTQLEYLLRIIAAMVCGGVIGFEREHRVKSAGLKTHMIVSMGAALMMIVSKYGFLDVLIYDGVSYDASRVAAGIVSAIGFLGAGVIFTRDFKVTGVTTAAGLWTTVGVGMLMGAGLYFIGAVSTLLVILIQLFFCRFHFHMRSPVDNVSIHAIGTRTDLDELRKLMQNMNCTTVRTKFTAVENDPDKFRMELHVIISDSRECEKRLLDLFEGAKAHVTSISVEPR